MLIFYLILGLIGFFIFWAKPARGLYLVVFLAPFLGLALNFSSFEWTRNLPYLKNIDAPLADFAVMFLAGVVGLKILYDWWRGKARIGDGWRFLTNSAGFFYFLPFLAVGALSLINVDYEQFNGSLKYLSRPILFFYLMWVCLPVILIKTETVLDKVIKILFWTGLLSAMMGLLSLFINPAVFGFWRRAGPLVWGSWAPMGWNHNLLAEWLAVVAPLAFYLFAASYHPFKKFYFLGFILITAVAMFTFARAAWIALAVELIIYWWFFKRPSFSRLKEEWPIIFIILPLFIYMFFFSLSPLVSSSNATRLDLTGIAWTYFKFHPWIGNGVGTFIPLVEQTRIFAVEYGDPLDAHGVLQKLLAEQGMLGLMAFTLFAGWVVHRVFQGYRRAEGRHRLLLFCFLLSVVGGLTYQLFNTSYYNQHLWLVAGVGLAAVKGLGDRV